MKEINPNDYAYVAANLAAEIEARNFFSGTIRTEHDGFTSELLTTLIIYRQKPQADCGPTPLLGPITDVVPVWWELHTFEPDGEEVFNDFSFSDVKPLLLRR